MGKYEALAHFLARKHAAEIPMTFAQIQRVIGSPLPRSATAHRPWWANEARGHVHAKAWLGAGYETAEVDMAAKKLVFKRTTKRSAENANGVSGMSDAAREFQSANSAEKKAHRSPLFGAMKGTFTLVPPGDSESMPEDPDSWEALALAKFDRLLFGKGT